MDIWTIMFIAAAFMSGYIYREIKFIGDITRGRINRERAASEAKAILGAAGIKEVVHLNHEMVAGVHYFYTADGGTFAGQGRSLDEAAKHYALLQGQDKIGWFKHIETSKQYCFTGETCTELGGSSE